MCLHGLGPHRLERTGRGYVVKTNALASFDVAEGFERYGGDVHLDEQFRPVRIVRLEKSEGGRGGLVEVEYLPGCEGWEYVKYCFRCSLFTLVTIVDHLYGVHLQWANGMVVACREQLGADHPVRRFLTPYYFGTIQVNHIARHLLVAQGSLGARNFAFSDEGLRAAWQAVPEVMVDGAELRGGGCSRDVVAEGRRDREPASAARSSAGASPDPALRPRQASWATPSCCASSSTCQSTARGGRASWGCGCRTTSRPRRTGAWCTGWSPTTSTSGSPRPRRRQPTPSCAAGSRRSSASSCTRRRCCPRCAGSGRRSCAPSPSTRSRGVCSRSPRTTSTTAASPSTRRMCASAPLRGRSASSAAQRSPPSRRRLSWQPPPSPCPRCSIGSPASTPSRSTASCAPRATKRCRGSRRRAGASRKARSRWCAGATSLWRRRTAAPPPGITACGPSTRGTLRRRSACERRRAENAWRVRSRLLIPPRGEGIPQAHRLLLSPTCRFAPSWKQNVHTGGGMWSERKLARVE
mmetsp:Transcript_26340/g.83699  ORF Transcript_26340/g.83699 Transcript_26340/m.83699 type:complete len:523 (-) Transcript_26340:141-1709(-)